jgi:hypothetical protein
LHDHHSATSKKNYKQKIITIIRYHGFHDQQKNKNNKLIRYHGFHDQQLLRKIYWDTKFGVRALMNDPSQLPFESVRNGGQADSNEFMMGIVANGVFELAKVYGHTGEEKVRLLILMAI